MLGILAEVVFFFAISGPQTIAFHEPALDFQTAVRAISSSFLFCT